MRCRALREMLVKCASTTLSSKLVSTEREYFAEMCVEAVEFLDEKDTSLKNVGVKKVAGGALQVGGVYCTKCKFPFKTGRTDDKGVTEMVKDRIFLSPPNHFVCRYLNILNLKHGRSLPNHSNRDYKNHSFTCRSRA